MHIRDRLNRFYRDQEGADRGGNDQQQTGGNQEGENNNEDNVDDFSKLWDNTPDNEGDTTQKTQQQTQQQQQTPGKTPQELLDEHFASIDFTAGIDAAKLLGSLSDGSTDDLQAALNEVGKNAYSQAITTMNKITEAKIAKAVEQAVAKSSANSDTNNAIRFMNDKLPFTKNPEVSPVATAVLAQMMKSGLKLEDATDKVGKFFTHVAKTSAKDLGLNKPPRSSPGNSNFAGIGDEDNAQEEDWIKTLTGGA